jgi:signal-transduction protein with cAMP-binding, CBS, and nucleotidyltransferase domain
MPTQEVSLISLQSSKPTSDPKLMEQIKRNSVEDANFEARTVKDIIEPAKSISNKVSVRAALDQMQAQAIDSSPVTDQCGELLGILTKNEMNRNVGGFGHDPKTEPVEAHIENNNAYCFEDQTIAEAEQMMLNAKLGEVFVITREKLLVGTISIEAIAQEKRWRKRFSPPRPTRPKSATIAVRSATPPLVINKSLKR